MAIGMFKLSYRQRQQLSTIFITLNIVQVLLGFGMTSSSIYILVAVAPVLHTEEAEIDFAFTVTGIYGTHVIFHWIIGIKMCRKSLKQAHKKSTSDLLLLWYCAGTNTVIILLIISHFARRNGKHIIKSMKNSITTGITNYLRDASWKETIDRLQYNNECCGISSHENWHEMDWISRYQVDVNSETVKQYKSGEDGLKLPVTPWSCCKIDFPMQCLHDPLQQSQYAHVWVDEPTIVKDSINSKGCLDDLKKPITAVIGLFIFFSSMVLILHIIIFLISRILYTSARNAVLLNDIEGISPGWIFGRGDCGYSRGKTLGEIMGVTVVEEETTKKTDKRDLRRMLPKRFRRKKKEDEESIADETTGDMTTTKHEEPSAFDPQFHSSKRDISEVTKSMEGEFHTTTEK
ncbi:hypothetical protein NQ317_000700 [Molorchus minor]|uniref:Uncharacterized protein n=1 Tax=Molorchus minor TaxID=1323400 RepID=A0ABQ9JB84_9CUCU|nr:hypothetical protein NQ317_000700 [Molorchus minor]